MDGFTASAILLTLAATFAFLNYRFIRLPMTIALMLFSLIFSLVLLGVGALNPDLLLPAREAVAGIDFRGIVLDIMLGYLLFAGALHVDLSSLASQWKLIATLATVGVMISTALIGVATFYLLGALGFDVPFIHCLLFGALISPTDPIAVLGILKQAGAPKSLETKITGESLFNDGIGVVVFLAILGIVEGGGAFDGGQVAKLFIVEAVGGIAFGLALGALAFWLLRRVDDHKVEVLITLAVVTAGYKLAGALHMSGPLAMVVTGLMIGNHGRALAMSSATVDRLDTFWELIDEILNALLFVLIGLELLVVTLDGQYLLAGLLSIVLVLACRFTAVSIPVFILSRFRTFSPRVIRILTWGGLRGGISVALALAVPEDANRDLFLVMTYAVVIFSIAVQGLTLKRLFRS